MQIKSLKACGTINDDLNNYTIWLVHNELAVNKYLISFSLLIINHFEHIYYYSHQTIIIITTRVAVRMLYII